MQYKSKKKQLLACYPVDCNPWYRIWTRIQHLCHHRHVVFVLVAVSTVHTLLDYGKVNPQLLGALHTIFRDSRKSRQKMAKNTADFRENRKNHGKNTANTEHEITGPNTIIQSIKFNI